MNENIAKKYGWTLDRASGNLIPTHHYLEMKAKLEADALDPFDDESIYTITAPTTRPTEKGNDPRN